MPGEREKENEREQPKLNLEKCQPAKSRGINANARWRNRITETKRKKGGEDAGRGR